MAAELALQSKENFPQVEIHLHTFGSSETAKGNILFIPDYEALEKSSDAKLEIESQLTHLKSEFPFSALLSAPEHQNPSQLYLESLVEYLEKAKLKRLTVVGYRSGALIALNLALRSRDLVRRLALVEPKINLEKKEHSRILLAFEKLIPFGLPLRSSHRQASLSNYAHRVRCPTLIIETKKEPSAIRAIFDRIPNAREFLLHSSAITSGGTFSEELNDCIRNFVDVPAKRSQKNSD